MVSLSTKAHKNVSRLIVVIPIHLYSSYRMLLDLLQCQESLTYHDTLRGENVQMCSLFQWIEKAINVAMHNIRRPFESCSPYHTMEW